MLHPGLLNQSLSTARKPFVALTRFMWSLGPLRRSINCAVTPGTTPAKLPVRNRNGVGDVRVLTRRHDQRPNVRRRRRSKGRVTRCGRTTTTFTEHQQARLAWVAKVDPRLHCGYLLKEGLRFVFQIKGDAGKAALDRWLKWAQRCRNPRFVELGRKIRRHRPKIDASLEHGLSNALIESTNTKIGVLTPMAYGFKSPDALIALAMLSLGGHRPDLPGRNLAP